MPQLIPFTFVNQISYGYLILLFLSYFLSTYILPTYILKDISRLSLITPWL